MPEIELTASDLTWWS